MKKVAIFAKTAQKAFVIKELIQSYGFIYDEESPDFMITLGGDGTLLMAEEAFPGLPKLPVRDSLICFKCHDEPIETLLEIITTGRSVIKSFSKLSVTADGKRLVAVNEICIRNRDQRRSLRFKVRINDNWIDEVLIGDGVVVATRFGATAYFKSITRQTFMMGIGIGFNNLRNDHPSVVIDENSLIEVKIVRQTGIVSADNQEELISLGEGASAVISKSEDICRFVTHE